MPRFSSDDSDRGSIQIEQHVLETAWDWFHQELAEVVTEKQDIEDVTEGDLKADDEYMDRFEAFVTNPPSTDIDGFTVTVGWSAARTMVMESQGKNSVPEAFVFRFERHSTDNHTRLKYRELREELGAPSYT